MNKIYLLIFIAFVSSSAFAAPTDLYGQGKKAYDKKDYITALKYLFAYRVLHDSEFQNQPEKAEELDIAIQNSEENLRRIEQIALDNLYGRFRGFGGIHVDGAGENMGPLNEE